MKRKDTPLAPTVFPNGSVVKMGRKKHARKSRQYAHHVEGEPSGSKSTHLMVDDILDSSGKPRKKGPYHVFPSITTSKSGYKFQNENEAYRAGEVYQFKRRKRAEKFAHGSWKKGRDRRDAMKAYRKSKKR